MKFLNQPIEIFGKKFPKNTLHDLLIAAAIVVASVVVLLIAKRLLLRRWKTLAERTTTHFDDGVVEVLERTRTLLMFLVAVYFGALALKLPASTHHVLAVVAIASVLVQIGIWSSSAIKFTVAVYRRRKQTEGDSASLSTLSVLSIGARFVTWVVVVLLLLANFGVDITALVAGLGVGGVAIALAVQTMLSDVFASVSIMLDKPFQVGDFIVVGDFLGNVENVGIKTTRVRSLSGEQLIFGNHDLLSARIRNYKRMEERRILFTIGVTYQTPADKVEAIPGILREAVEAQEKVRFDRAHFKSYGDSALIFEIVYYVLSPDYTLYMDIQQAINLILFRQFAERGIEFAYPTQTVFVQKYAA